MEKILFINQTFNMSNDTLIVKNYCQNFCVYPLYDFWILINFLFLVFIRINTRFRISEIIYKKVFNLENYSGYFIAEKINADLLGDLLFINLIMFIFQMGIIPITKIITGI